MSSWDEELTAIKAISSWDEEPIVNINQSYRNVTENISEVPTLSTTNGGNTLFWFICGTVIVLLGCAAFTIPLCVSLSCGADKTTTIISTTITTITTSTTSTTSTASTTTGPLTACPSSNATGGTYLSSGTPLFYTYQVLVSCSSYLQIAWLYTAQSANETISFSIYNSPGYTYIDDVSIIDTSTSQQLISNGGFESGQTNWSGTATAYISQPGGCFTGSWCYYDGSSSSHSIYQTVLTTIGHTLSVSFYIKWTGTGNGVYSNITITP